MKPLRGTLDLGILAASLLLLGIGIVLVFSSSFAVAEDRYGGAFFFLSRQVSRALLAVALFVLFINIDYHVWVRFANIGLAAAAILLVVVLVSPHAHAVKGARRWVSLGFVTFQASEFARMALIVFLARHLGQAGEEIKRWNVLSRQLVAILLVSGLIVLEPNFSTAMVVALVGGALVFVSGASIVQLGGILIAGVPLALLGMMGAGYRSRRVMAFLNPDQFKETVGYQANQAIIGLGNGGLFGTGLGQGQQKLFYLPEPHTDFVFSILGEEIGFVGLMAVLGLFAFVIIRGTQVALRAPDKTGQLMAFGFTFALAVYVLLHACVNTGLVPTTGVPLPFLSYGGMSLVFTMCGMGIILNISSQIAHTSPLREGRARRGGVASGPSRHGGRTR